MWLEEAGIAKIRTAVLWLAVAGIVEFNRRADFWLEKAGIADVKEQLNAGEKRLAQNS